ncbi:DUF2085 domain-containing protein [Thalassoroseus pseudoceratinae]|uniref:DUF2085 domain-containing protein n=1 Tax=Thalassoroseus pseudoceratinae TaxID=2713176 RepID=UPI00141F523A|nr:DUF2085 domain-containing protein [Thalassoroseus pseudoceratinae]
MHPRTIKTTVCHTTIAVLGGLHVLLLLLWPFWKGTSIGCELDELYYQLCHRITDRCWMSWGEPMPVCARCLGIWIGLPLAAGIAAAACDRPRWWTIRVGLFGLIWILLSWIGGLIFLPATWHAERTIAGMAGGVGIYMLLVLGVTHFVQWKQSLCKPLLTVLRSSDGKTTLQTK